MSSEPSQGQQRRPFLEGAARTAAAAAAATTAAIPAAPALALFDEKTSDSWQQVTVPASTTLYDIDFDGPNQDHGYIVGAGGTFLESTDGGKNWGARSFSNLDEEEEINYRFTHVSFKDGTGWVVGKPAILLHTKDEGKSWERLPLSPKLPGDPATVHALGGARAEMTTTTGAVYYTENDGRNWKAQVKETIDATLNRISSAGVSGASYFTGSITATKRDASGSYLAVSSRGNFYLTWSPGQDYWIPHNRGTSRRIQSMGFVGDEVSNGLWMTLNGGKLSVAEAPDLSADTPGFVERDITSGGYGIIDVAWRSKDEAWAVGGSGTLWMSKDGGKTFKFNNAADKISGNLYQVNFFNNGKVGFILGSDGVLLRRTGFA